MRTTINENGIPSTMAGLKRALQPGATFWARYPRGLWVGTDDGGEELDSWTFLQRRVVEARPTRIVSTVPSPWEARTSGLNWEGMTYHVDDEGMGVLTVKATGRVLCRISTIQTEDKEG